jgi:hypothetical protein
MLPDRAENPRGQNVLLIGRKLGFGLRGKEAAE